MTSHSCPVSISVVIPTRERASTLGFSLQTVIAQEYQDLEIIVSDNVSEDGTCALIQNYCDADPRVRYINPGKRLGMSEHWEFALSHVTGQYVIFMGDDDGLLPHAIRDIVDILTLKGMPELMTWAQTVYMWPDVPSRFCPGILRVPLQQKDSIAGERIVEPKPPFMLGKLIMREYPSIYNKSVVSSALINRIKSWSNGSFFKSRIPDIYSGVVLGSASRDYPIIGKSFSVNAQSGRSNGIAFTQSLKSSVKSEASLFLEESTTQLHRGVGCKMTGNLTLLWWECILQAQDNLGDFIEFRLPNPESVLRSAFFASYSIADDQLFNSEVSLISDIARQYGLGDSLKQWALLARRNKATDPQLAPGYDSSINYLSIDTIQFDVKNVFEAARMAYYVSNLEDKVFSLGWKYRQGLLHKYKYYRQRLSVSNIIRFFLTRI